MFDLESEIRRWRAALAGKLPPATVNELENHLREETDRRLKSGTPQDEAFRQACLDLGDPTRLSAEFAKLNGASIWRPARLASVAALSLTAFLLVLAIVAGASGRKTPLLSAHVMSVSAGYLISFILGALAIWYVVVRLFRNLSMGHAASLRKVVALLAGASALLTGAAIITGVIWAADHMGRYWAWHPKETAAFVIFAWNLALALLAYAKRIWLHPVMLLAIFGNAITSVGWFGSNAAHGHFQLPSLLLAFVVAQMIFIAAGCLPRKNASNTLAP